MHLGTTLFEQWIITFVLSASLLSLSLPWNIIASFIVTFMVIGASEITPGLAYVINGDIPLYTRAGGSGIPNLVFISQWTCPHQFFFDNEVRLGGLNILMFEQNNFNGRNRNNSHETFLQATKSLETNDRLNAVLVILEFDVVYWRSFWLAFYRNRRRLPLEGTPLIFKHGLCLLDFTLKSFRWLSILAFIMQWAMGNEAVFHFNNFSYFQQYICR